MTMPTRKTLPRSLDSLHRDFHRTDPGSAP
jgi:hypothetical protein